MALTDVEKVRVLIGLGTNSPFHDLLTDEEIEWYIEMYPNSILAAAKQAAISAGFAFSQINTKEKYGEVEAWNEVATAYPKALAAFIDDVSTSLALPVGLMPYAAGISVESLLASRCDPDNPNIFSFLYRAGENRCCVNKEPSIYFIET